MACHHLVQALAFIASISMSTQKSVFVGTPLAPERLPSLVSSSDSPEGTWAARTCDLTSLEGCLANEYCVAMEFGHLEDPSLTNLSLHALVGQCECVHDHVRNTDSKLCTAVLSNITTGRNTTPSSSEVAVFPSDRNTSLVTSITPVVHDNTMDDNGTSSGSGSKTKDKSADNNATKAEGAPPELAAALTTQDSGKALATTGSSTSMEPTLSASTTPTTSQQPRVVQPLTVSAGNDVTLQYPNNSVELTASVSPLPTDQDVPVEQYKFKWSLTEHPKVTSTNDGASNSGTMEGMTDPTLKLTDLIPGVYRLKLVVEGAASYGESAISITVLPVVRINQPPVAIIKPSEQQITHGNKAVLDGSESTDDDKIATYLWEIVSKPIGSSSDMNNRDRSMLQLDNLLPGLYSIRLTVTDSDGLKDSSMASVTVIKEVDYPPKANAGSDVIISMPQNEVVLMGNASTDDKGIASYEWTKKTDSLAADALGARSPFFHLSNLQAGDYTFTLKVTDTAGQTSSDDVHVFVKSEHNHAPVAKVTNTSLVVRLTPDTAVVLDGSLSTDDHEITRHEWVQLTGPVVASLLKSDRAKATATALEPGDYLFRLTVYDEELRQDSAEVKVTATENINRPPVADAGGNRSVLLPQQLLVIDGSKSRDDDGRIVSYKWSRGLSSPAAGNSVGGSDHEAMLQLTGIVAGHYTWTLQVTDDEGLSSSDQCYVDVLPDSSSLNLVELFLEAPIEVFSVANKNTLATELGLLLHQTGTSSDETRVLIRSVAPDSLTGTLVVTFLVYEGNSPPDLENSFRPGADVARMLKEKLRKNTDILEFQVLAVDTLVCQSNCSGHGHCDRYSKKCVCNSFWMQNIVNAYMYGESDCGWSVLYVSVVSLGVALAVPLGVCLCVCQCQCRRCRRRPKNRRAYELVNDSEKDEVKPISKKLYATLEDQTNNNQRGSLGGWGTPQPQSSSLLLSDSELSSDEDTLFVNGSTGTLSSKWAPTTETVNSREPVASVGGSRA